MNISSQSTTCWDSTARQDGWTRSHANVGYSAEGCSTAQSHSGRRVQPWKAYDSSVWMSTRIALPWRSRSPDGESRARWRRFPDTVMLLKRLRKLGPVKCCYEAGPTGFVLQRDLTMAGIGCIVVAPSPADSAARAQKQRGRPHERSRPVDGFNHIGRGAGQQHSKAARGGDPPRLYLR